MTGCFSCFSLPKAKDDVKDFVAPDCVSHKSKKEKRRPLTGDRPNRPANDKLSSSLLKESKKGAVGVLAAVEEVSEQQWCSGLSDSTVRARASAINCCIDTLLAPLLGAVEAMVGKPGKGAEGGWESLQLPEIVNMAIGVAESATSCDMAQLSVGVGRLLGMLLSVWRECDMRWESARGTTFQNQSINMLLGMASIVLCRQVAHDSEAVWTQRRSEWRLVERTFGLDGPGLGVALSPPNKALLVYLFNAAEHGEGKLSLRVQRKLAFHETVEQLKQAGKLYQRTGAVKVFPLFLAPGENGAVEAGEGHGPRKEFFVQAGAGMVHDNKEQRGNPPVFTYVRSAGQYSLNLSLPRSTEMEGLVWTAGWVAGQTIANRSLLGAPLPTLLFERLLRGDDFRADMAVLQEFDPEAAKAIQNTTRLRDADFQQLLDLEDCTGMSRDEYTRHAAASALGDGFWSVLPKSALLELHVTAEDLCAMVCGPLASRNPDDDFTVEKVFRIVLDEELGGDSSSEAGDGEEAPAAPLAKALWEVVGAWTPELKRKFVLFCTGSERLPLPGTELLRVELPFVAFSASDHKKMLGMLPQAHTCENVLELPNYWEAVVRVEAPGTSLEELGEVARSRLYENMKRVLEERLRLAVTTCNSYGLDEGVGREGSRDGGLGNSVVRSNVSTVSTTPRTSENSPRHAGGTNSDAVPGGPLQFLRVESGLGSAETRLQHQYIRTTSTNTILPPAGSYLSALADKPMKIMPSRREDLAPLSRIPSAKGVLQVAHDAEDETAGLQVLDLDGWTLPGSTAQSNPALQPLPPPRNMFREKEDVMHYASVTPPVRDSSIDDLISDLGVGTLTL